MDKREKCKALMLKLFGPATAKMVDSLPEEECISICKDKVMKIYGPEKAKEFDNI